MQKPDQTNMGRYLKQFQEQEVIIHGGIVARALHRASKTLHSKEQVQKLINRIEAKAGWNKRFGRRALFKFVLTEVRRNAEQAARQVVQAATPECTGE